MHRAIQDPNRKMGDSNRSLWSAALPKGVKRAQSKQEIVECNSHSLQGPWQGILVNIRLVQATIERCLSSVFAA